MTAKSFFFFNYKKFGFFKRYFVYFFLECRGGRRRERDIDVGEEQGWVASRMPELGTWPTSLACALTGNQMCSLFVHSPVLTPLNHTSQGKIYFLNGYKTYIT